MSVRTIQPNELYEQVQGNDGVELIDVRTLAEFREVHAEGARLVPLDVLDPDEVMAGRSGAEGEPLYVICRSGSRARQACERFLAAGYDCAVCVEGGTGAWERAGLPVERGTRSISLQGQVSIAAGLLILVGAVLGVLVHPYFLAVPAVVGAGLVFTGVTGSCALGMLMMRMPWNRPREDSAQEKAGQGDACCSR